MLLLLFRLHFDGVLEYINLENVNSVAVRCLCVKMHKKMSVGTLIYIQSRYNTRDYNLCRESHYSSLNLKS